MSLTFKAQDVIHKRSAFTMIELIFVIVIIGILAAIAIPKFMATRDDAKVAKMMMSVGNVISEITNYANAKKATTTDLSKMSNSLKGLAINGEANCSEENISIIKMDGVDCIKLEIVHSATNNDLNVSMISTTNRLCKYLQDEIKPKLYEVRLNGTVIKF